MDILKNLSVTQSIMTAVVGVLDTGSKIIRLLSARCQQQATESTRARLVLTYFSPLHGTTTIILHETERSFNERTQFLRYAISDRP